MSAALTKSDDEFCKYSRGLVVAKYWSSNCLCSLEKATANYSSLSLVSSELSRYKNQCASQRAVRGIEMSFPWF